MKVLYFHFVGFGHIYPALTLIQELKQHNIEVISYIFERDRAIFDRTGSSILLYKELEQEQGATHTRMRMGARLVEQTLLNLPDILEFLETNPVDFIMTDSLQPMGWYLKQLTGLPLIVLNTLFAHPGAVMEAFPSAKRLLGSTDAPDYDEHVIRFDKAIQTFREQYGKETLPFEGGFQVPGDLTIVTTSRELQPVDHLLDDRFAFVGPLFEKRAETANFPYSFLDEKSSIYISLGTDAAHEEFFELCVTAFAGTDYHVLMSAGGKEIELENLPENILLREYVPQLDVLQHIDLFVTHAGWNSVNEALYYDVPLVAIPQGRDQFGNATAIEQSGAGIYLKDLSADSLREAAETILNTESYRENAKKIGESLRSAGGVKEASRRILDLIQ